MWASLEKGEKTILLLQKLKDVGFEGEVYKDDDGRKNWVGGGGGRWVLICN